MNELAKIESFRKDLAIAETFEEIKLLTDASTAYASLLKKQGISLDKQNEIGRFRIEIMEKMGQWLEEAFPHGVRSDRRVTSDGTLPNKMPASNHESSQSRRIAFADPQLKANIIQAIEKKGDVITPK